MIGLRVPPAVSFAFEQIVSKVCDEAKVDYDERPFVTRELQNHLEAFWRREIEKGLSTDDAQQRALACFGRLKDVARNLRQPLLKRLLLFERYRAERFIVFLCIAVAIGFCVAANELACTQLAKFEGSALGYMLNPIIAISSLFIIRWQPTLQNGVLRLLARIRYIVSPLIVTGMLNVLYGPIRQLRALGKEGFQTDFGYLFLFLGFLLLTPLGLLAACCYLSELFGLPQRRKRRRSALGE